MSKAKSKPNSELVEVKEITCLKGKEFRLARIKAAKTMREIADHCGVTVPYISDIERGFKVAKGSLAFMMIKALKK